MSPFVKPRTVAGDSGYGLKPFAPRDQGKNFRVAELVDANKRPVTLEISAHVAQGRIFYNNSDSWGESYSLLVGFSEEEAHALSEIAAMVTDYSWIHPDEYEMKPLFPEEGSHDFWFRLKVDKKDPKRFAFKSNLSLIPNPEKLEVRGLSKGQAVTIFCEAFAWYNKEKEQCGLGFKLVELDFEKPARAAKASGRKGSTQEDGEH
jgi:hypothetical protein